MRENGLFLLEGVSAGVVASRIPLRMAEPMFPVLLAAVWDIEGMAHRIL
jgi:hypothetical protein